MLFLEVTNKPGLVAVVGNRYGQSARNAFRSYRVQKLNRGGQCGLAIATADQHENCFDTTLFVRERVAVDAANNSFHPRVKLECLLGQAALRMAQSLDKLYGAFAESVRVGQGRAIKYPLQIRLR
jgi:hypothetical protein